MAKKVSTSVIIIIFIFCFLYFVPLPVRSDFQLTGTVRGAQAPAGCSVSFTGYELRYLFKADTLKGTVTVNYDSCSFTSDISGPIVSIPDGEPNENINWASCVRYDAEQNHYVSCTLYFTDDRKVFVLAEDNLFFCVSELGDAEAEIIFDQIVDFAS